MAPNPARPAPGAALIAADKIKRGEAVVLDFAAGDAAYSLIVAHGEAGFVAYENVCPHAEAPLERFDGHVLIQERRYIVCAMHGASFRIEDGECVGGPALGMCLTPAPVAVEDGVVRLK
jgi:nitrite reductase/ring-hydroxylating ferredoxin subunit